MKIKSIRSLGLRQTYSPELASSQHNYLTEQSGAVHRNSHAVSYCLVAYRCLWLKAHFAPEWWAAVMSGCHPDKLVRYMSVARAEAWKPTDITYCGKHKPAVSANGVTFDTININNLTTTFTVTGDTVNQGLVGIKKVGKKGALIYTGRGQYNNIDEFVAGPKRRNKTVLERFIKLGAFSHLPGHENARAVWTYYRYAYCSGTDITKLRSEIKQQLLAADGWTDAAVAAERERQTQEYRRTYPKRNKIPAKISNWRPKPDDRRERVIALTTEDFSLSERLAFQKEFLGYYIDSPLDLFDIEGGGTIAEAKENAKYTKEVKLEVIIVDAQRGLTKNESEYMRLTVSDGIQRALVLIWSSELGCQDEELLKREVGVRMFVEYDEKRNSFSLARGESLIKLLPRPRNRSVANATS